MSVERGPVQMVEVSMGGRLYRLRGTDGEQLRALAREVDQAMAEVSPHDGPVEDIKVAVLAALNIAGTREGQNEEVRKRLEQAAQRLAALKQRLAQIDSDH